MSDPGVNRRSRKRRADPAIPEEEGQNLANSSESGRPKRSMANDRLDPSIEVSTISYRELTTMGHEEATEDEHDEAARDEHVEAKEDDYDSPDSGLAEDSEEVEYDPASLVLRYRDRIVYALPLSEIGVCRPLPREGLTLDLIPGHHILDIARWMEEDPSAEWFLKSTEHENTILFDPVSFSMTVANLPVEIAPIYLVAESKKRQRLPLFRSDRAPRRVRYDLPSESRDEPLECFYDIRTSTDGEWADLSIPFVRHTKKNGEIYEATRPILRRRPKSILTAPRVASIPGSEKGALSTSTPLLQLLGKTESGRIFDDFESYFEAFRIGNFSLLGVGGFGTAVSVTTGTSCGERRVMRISSLTRTGSEGMCLHEHRMAQAMSDLKKNNPNASFPEYFGCHIIKGAWPSWLQDVAQDPDLTFSIAEADSLWFVMMLEFGGACLDAYAMNYSRQGNELSLKHQGYALSILAQVLKVLQTAEAAIQFEHRDAHLGNILVSENDPNQEEIVFRGSKTLPAYGLKVMLIDFSLSRCELSLFDILYWDIDLDSPGILNQSGTLQYEMYRKMRQLNGGRWDVFCPRTNALWIEFIVEKFTNQIRYASTQKRAKAILAEYRELLRVRKPPSASECLRLFADIL